MMKNKSSKLRMGKCVVKVKEGCATEEYINVNANENVTKIQIRSCRLFHGAYSWALTFLKNVVTLGIADSLAHWWVVMETDQGNFYCAQIYPDDCYTLDKCKSSEECDANGVICANRPPDCELFTEASHNVNFPLKFVVEWMKEKHFAPSYSFTSHNSHDFSKELVSYCKKQPKESVNVKRDANLKVALR